MAGWTSDGSDKWKVRQMTQFSLRSDKLVDGQVSWSDKCQVRQMTHFSLRSDKLVDGQVSWSDKCQVGQMTHFSLRSDKLVDRQVLWSDKCQVGQMSIGQTSVAQNLRHRVEMYYSCACIRQPANKNNKTFKLKIFY